MNIPLAPLAARPISACDLLRRGGIGGHDTYTPRCYCPYMARLARIVIPGLPHHVTQRGNRREAIFFQDGDHEIYLDLLAEQTLKADVAVWAYCLTRFEAEAASIPFGHRD